MYPFNPFVPFQRHLSIFENSERMRLKKVTAALAENYIYQYSMNVPLKKSEFQICNMLVN